MENNEEANEENENIEKDNVKNYILPMRESIASILGINPEQVSVKATTHEKLGLVGNEEAIASEAVVLICKKEE